MTPPPSVMANVASASGMSGLSYSLLRGVWRGGEADVS